MAQDITINGIDYAAVPGIQVPKTAGGTALFLDSKDYVAYAAQQKTDAEKAQARANINAAAPDGYYGDSGGVFNYAKNFVSSGASQEARDIAFRPTASEYSGDAWLANSITSSEATIKSIKGNTLYWNQLVGADTTSVATISGHTYVTKISGTFAMSVSTGQTLSVTGGSDMVIDITQMYPALAPETIGEFRAQFPLDYYQYNPGEFINVKATTLRTNGFNQWDEQWEHGYIRDDGTETGPTSQFRNVGYIPVFPGMWYRCTSDMLTSTNPFQLMQFDANKNFLRRNSVGSPWLSQQIRSNARYVRFWMDGEYKGSGTCFNLEWSGIRNGEYEPGWVAEKALPVATYFPNGMNGIGTECDEIRSDKYIIRIAREDMGTWNWTYRSGETQPRFNGFRSTGHINIVKRYDSRASTVNCFCSIYKTFTYSEDFGAADMAIIASVGFDTHGNITVHDSRFTDAASFKAAMSGVYLYYVMTEPIETPIDPPLDLKYRCDDFGTEMILPENTDVPVTAPMHAEIAYAMDYEAQIRNNPRLNITKESMDNFISAFNASGIGRITQTWDGGNKRYTYTITR